MRPGRRLIMVIGAMSAAAFVVSAVVTRLLACGVSGCSGAGFGPAFAPAQAQIGFVVCGALLIPLAVVLLRARPPLVRIAGALGALVLGALLAMALLGLGANGCPFGQSRARASAEDVSPGALTCRADAAGG